MINCSKIIKFFKIYKLILIALVVHFNLNAQDLKLEYSTNLTISDGLAHNGVTSILEDSKGYLWFGTYDGINKFDGYEFKTFKNTFNQDLLTSNRVRTITEDTKGNLWIGTDDGITIYNYSKEKFEKLRIDKLNQTNTKNLIVRKILISNNLIICTTEESGILIFKDDYTLVKQYFPPMYQKNTLYFDIIPFANSKFLVSSSSGVLLFDVEQELFLPVLSTEITHSKSVLKVDKNYLIVTLASGLLVVEYTPVNNSFSFKIKKREFLEENFFASHIDDEGDLWLGTNGNGILHVENVKLLVENKPFKKEVFKADSGLLRISSFETSNNNDCWVGTFNEGIFKFDTKKNPFKNYNSKMNYAFGLKSNDVAYLSPIDKDRVLISANRGGLVLFNTATNKFEPLPFKIPNEFALRIASIFMDSKEDVWIKITNEGFYRLKKGAKTIEKVVFSGNNFFQGVQSKTFAEDKFGNIWIGASEGLFKLILNKNREIVRVEEVNRNPFFKKKEISLVRKVYMDPLHDFVWVGSDTEGLFRLNVNESIETGAIKQFVKSKKPNSISANFVSSIIRLPNEEMWIGTEGGGICKVVNSETSPEFIAYTELNGLSNNVVKSVLYDDEYNLWISTNIGLNKFNTKDLKFRRFNDSDGLPFEDFWYSSKKLGNGELFFSGMDGFCYFNPKDISDKEKLPNVEFDNFKILNKSVAPLDTLQNRVVLEKRLTELDQIKLKFNENVFSLDITSLHFLNPKNHYIKYKLLPLNKDWIELESDKKTIYFNGLQPGEYELNVMVSNSLNEWTAPKKLKIIITPPFWKTGWAYLLYILAWVFVIFIVVYFVYRIQNLNHNLQIEQLEKNNVNEVNAAKLQFFSNISHEIKTPITLISGPIDILLDWFKNNFEVIEKLQLVQRQTKKISQLIDQVHDFQRADANLLKMNYAQFSFNSFIKGLVNDFDFMAKKESRTLLLEAPEDIIYVSADKDKLEKIFNNLINNAFKYSNANDTIKISFYAENTNLIVNVSDTGRGIDSEDLPHVFERFYQSHNSHSSYTGGSGIGLAFSKRLVDMHYGYINVESEMHKGSNFKVCVPIVLKNYNENQDDIDQEILSKEASFEEKEYAVENLNLTSVVSDPEFANTRIFFAEDNFEMRNFISGILSNFFNVTTFTNGQECLNALSEDWPDIVVSDVLMPELNGFDLCKAIKSDIKTSHIPVVLLTACTAIEDQIQGINEGADAYIRKPFNVQRLVSTIESLLRIRKQLRERFKIDFPLTLEKSSENNSKDTIFLEKLYSLMQENLDNPEVDMNELAKKLYLNRTHFYQKVKALTDQTPFELLKDYRLKKAAEYLVHQNMSVKEVFIVTGFKSRSHFSKRFKEKYNLTPGKYVSEGLKKLEQKK